MSGNQQRHDFLVACAQRALQGKKSFDLARAHLVELSGISKGTIYNHFASEADLIVSVAIADLKQFLAQAQELEQHLDNPFDIYLAHQCQRLQMVLEQDRFVICKVMPNPDLVAQASEFLQASHRQVALAYREWNQQLIARMGEVSGYNRYELAQQFIRGTLIDLDDHRPQGDLGPVYHQFCYALLQLLGHSAKRPPNQEQISNWLTLQAHIDAARLQAKRA
ncbi:TetR/AcrR family transcriptional regulator [Ferrimonas senticii]|uniref:TetR/AcrR family transcriptional regulator n=1 Tax=Ferrimonas senticii TaxID=394566 RepID=UPI0004036014|nr:TetR/AcrR family transcriptional regulator [Ferrimonas senticii]